MPLFSVTEFLRNIIVTDEVESADMILRRKKYLEQKGIPDPGIRVAASVLSDIRTLLKRKDIISPDPYREDGD